MRSEHCQKGGASYSFTTRNYRITTTPAVEWEVIVDGKPCLPENRLNNRRFPDLQELLTSDIAVQACLTLPEVIALVLYTGPMVGIISIHQDRRFQFTGYCDTMKFLNIFNRARMGYLLTLPY